MAEMIEVQPEHTLADLLALIAARHAADPAQPVILAVPRGIALLRQMESYQAFKEATKHNDLRLKIRSPDARVVGLALVFGIDAETVAAPPGSGPGTRPLVAPPTMPPVASPAVALPPTLPPAPVASPAVALPPALPPTPVAAAAESPVGLPLPSGAGAPAAAAPAAEPRSVAQQGYSFPGQYPAATAPAEGPLSETDWLFGGDVDLDYILRDDAAADTRSATPPPDVALPGGLPPGLGRPAAPPPPPSAPIIPAVVADPTTPTDDLTWLTTGVDFAALAGGSLNPHAVLVAAGDSLIAPSGSPDAVSPALPPDLPPAPATLDLADEFGAVAAFDPFAPELGAVVPFAPDGASLLPAGGGSLGDLLLGGDDEEDAPAMSFSEWLALQKSSVAERTGLPAASDVDLSNLPSWLRPLPAAAVPPVPPDLPVAAALSPLELPPPSPVAPPVPPLAPKGTLRCPHCGEALDPEEMLRLLAQVWGT